MSPPKIVLAELETNSEGVDSNMTAVMVPQHSHTAVTRNNADLSPNRHLTGQYVLDNIMHENPTSQAAAATGNLLRGSRAAKLHRLAST